MAKYLIHVDVDSARGTQTWCVEANDESHARLLWAQGDGDLVSEELEADTGVITRIEPKP